MTPLKLLLKILIHFGMVSTEEKGILAKDIEEFELKAKPDNENKVLALYGKAIRSLWVRISLPFLFFFGVKYLKDMITEDDLDLDE